MNNLKEKAKIYWIKKADYYAKKGGYRNIIRSLRYLKWSAYLANSEERKFVSDMLNSLIEEQKRRAE